MYMTDTQKPRSENGGPGENVAEDADWHPYNVWRDQIRGGLGSGPAGKTVDRNQPQQAGGRNPLKNLAARFRRA